MKHDFSKQKAQNIFLNLVQNEMKPETSKEKYSSFVFTIYAKQPIEYTHMHFSEYFNDAYIIFVEKNRICCLSEIS